MKALQSILLVAGRLLIREALVLAGGGIAYSLTGPMLSLILFILLPLAGQSHPPRRPVASPCLREHLPARIKRIEGLWENLPARIERLQGRRDEAGGAVAAGKTITR